MKLIFLIIADRRRFGQADWRRLRVRPVIGEKITCNLSLSKVPLRLLNRGNRFRKK